MLRVHLLLPAPALAPVLLAALLPPRGRRAAPLLLRCLWQHRLPVGLAPDDIHRRLEKYLVNSGPCVQ